MSNVYISFLGTNDYLECTYVYEGAAPVTNIRFVQEATLKTFCSSWTNNDRIFIFTTEEAYYKNWLNDGHVHKDEKTGQRLKRTGLKKRIENLDLKPLVKRISIPEGKNEEEIWEIFEQLYNVLPEKSNLVFDITHSFRSIPMLAVVVLNYAKALKQIKISGIYYGAFEALGPISKVKEMEPEERIAPILDLTPLDALMEWSFAIDRYIGTGDARPVSSLTISSANEILKETKGRDEAARTIRNMGNALASFSKVMATCRGPEVVKISTWLKDEVANCEKLKLQPAFLPLFRRLKSQTARFRGDDILDGVEAAKWCLEHNLVQQAYTILEETIISYMVKSIGYDIHDRTIRDIATQALKILRDNTPYEQWHAPANKKREVTEAFCHYFKNNPVIRKQMDTLTQYRNDLNHAGYNENSMNADNFSAKLKQILDNICQILGK